MSVALALLTEQFTKAAKNVGAHEEREIIKSLIDEAAALLYERNLLPEMSQGKASEAIYDALFNDVRAKVGYTVGGMGV